jgi:hypothetical protein
LVVAAGPGDLRGSAAGDKQSTVAEKIWLDTLRGNMVKMYIYAHPFLAMKHLLFSEKRRGVGLVHAVFGL